MKSELTVQNEQGDRIAVTLAREGSKDVGKVIIDGVAYHVERMKCAIFKRQYRVDTDSEYEPQHDNKDNCVIIAPFSKR